MRNHSHAYMVTGDQRSYNMRRSEAHLLLMLTGALLPAPKQEIINNSIQNQGGKLNLNIVTSRFLNKHITQKYRG